MPSPLFLSNYTRYGALFEALDFSLHTKESEETVPGFWHATSAA